MLFHFVIPDFSAKLYIYILKYIAIIIQLSNEKLVSAEFIYKNVCVLCMYVFVCVRVCVCVCIFIYLFSKPCTRHIFING